MGKVMAVNVIIIALFLATVCLHVEAQTEDGFPSVEDQYEIIRKASANKQLDKWCECLKSGDMGSGPLPWWNNPNQSLAKKLKSCETYFNVVLQEMFGNTTIRTNDNFVQYENLQNQTSCTSPDLNTVDLGKTMPITPNVTGNVSPPTESTPEASNTLPEPNEDINDGSSSTSSANKSDNIIPNGTGPTTSTEPTPDNDDSERNGTPVPDKPDSEDSSTHLYWSIPLIAIVLLVMAIGGFFIHRYAKKAGFRQSSKTNGELTKVSSTEGV